MNEIGTGQSDNFNTFAATLDKVIKKLNLKPDNSAKKQIIAAITWKNEEAEKVIKKKEKNGTILYEPDAELRDNENVPLLENIDSYFNREVLPHVPDACIDYDKTTIGYEISFTKYFYKYQPLRGLKVITAELIEVEKESDGLLKKILQ